jgi:hypothetical protein
VPKQYGLEGFAIVLFCASLAMTLMVGACFFRVCVFSHTWFPDIWAGVSWIAACISAHTIINSYRHGRLDGDPEEDFSDEKTVRRVILRCNILCLG